MSFTYSSVAGAQSDRRSLLRKAGLAAASLSLALGTVPLASAPAQAGFPSKATNGPCTVTAIRPHATGELVGWPQLKQVAYPFKVECTTGGVTVYMQQQLREADNGKDYYQRDYFTPEGTPLEFYSSHTRDMVTFHPLLNTDLYGNEEVYHKIRFRLTGVDGADKWVYVQSPELSISAY